MRLVNLNVCLAVMCCLMLVGCSTDRADAGASALKQGDAITVKSDTFAVFSRMDECSPIYASPDSFLLGECETHYGAIKADILTQFSCPMGFSYPHQENAEVDSVCLFLYYNTWYGDGMAPLGITAYEMDGQVLQYDDPYPSNDTISKYCSMHDSVRVTPMSKLIVAQEYVDSSYSSSLSAYVPYVRIKLTDDFANRFFRIRDFSSQEQFNEQFKGLYITTDFGGATILYVASVSMAVYYHFTYQRSDGKDTTVADIKPFYANSEVRQINRFYYPDRADVLKVMNTYQDTTFVISPANIYTSIQIPMVDVYARMQEQFGDSADYRLYFNLANLKVDVLYDANEYHVSDRARDNWDAPSNYMLLIRQEEMSAFFSEHQLPNDTIAILGTLSSVTDTMEVTSYYYSYDLSSMLTVQFRTPNPVDTLRLLLVPVEVATTTSSSTTTVSEVSLLQTISATCLRSAKHSTQPMNLKMVYAAFNKTNR